MSPISACALALGAALIAAGCSRITVDLGAGGRTVFAPQDRLPPGVACQYIPNSRTSHFTIREKAHWIFWAVPLNHPDWEKGMQRALEGADGIGNVVIEVHATPGDVLVSLITVGFYRRATVVIRGDRMKFTNAEPPPEGLAFPADSPPPGSSPLPAVSSAPGQSRQLHPPNSTHSPDSSGTPPAPPSGPRPN